VSRRLHRLLGMEKHLIKDPEAAAYFYEADGRPRPVGTLLKNPQYAGVLKAVAEQGADAFYTGAIAQDIVRKVSSHPTNPGRLSLEDLARYKAVERPPVCGSFRVYKICGVGPPTSGGVSVLQILKLLEIAEPVAVPQTQPYATHLFADAGNLAFADRNRYLADPDFVQAPVAGLLDEGYLRARAALLHKERSLGIAEAGTPPGAVAQLGDDALSERAATSHLSIVDAEGNGVALTATIEDVFGSRQLVRGFLLNNELTDFSLAPTEGGRPVANRVEPGKRPRSSMAPTLVFTADGALHLLIGSPGGSAIINYVASRLIAILDWKLDVQAALDLPNVGGRNAPVDLEKGTAAESYKQPLEAMGHKTRVVDLTSGLSAIQLVRGRIEAGVDPRKEGVALGD
jgi:gamma-glutamyltranspeptidase/glutathione hydrolase